MRILAGTSRGVFLLEDVPRQVLHSRGVRELVCINHDLFAGTGAGLYRSTDAGEIWQPAGLEDFEVWQVRDAGDGSLLAGTQPAALFKSYDLGVSWAPVSGFNDSPLAAEWGIPLDPPLPGRARALVVDAQNHSRICAGVEVGGIMRSEDGGAHWDMVLPGENPDLHMMFQHPAKPEVLFASTGYGRRDGIAEMVEGNAGVFCSEDFGQSWCYRWCGIEPRYSRPMCIDARAPFSLTVASAPTAFSSYKDDAGAGAMLFRSDDEGRTWRSLCDPAHSPSFANFHGLVCDPEVPGGVLVGTDSGEIWRVTPDAQWTPLANELPAVLALTATL